MILLKISRHLPDPVAIDPLRHRSRISRIAIRLGLELWALILLLIPPLLLYSIYTLSVLKPVKPAWQQIEPRPSVAMLWLVGMMCWGVLYLADWTMGWFNNTKTLARRFTTADAAAVLAKDTRKPILYLRPFIDRYTGNDVRSQPESDENLIFPVLKEVGPVITMGHPGETLPPFGAARLYLDPDSDWKDSVISYFSQSRFVVITPGDSEGVIWETSQALQYSAPENIIISLVSFKKDLHYSKPIATYESFRNAVRRSTGIELPEEIGDSLFIYFDADRKPRLATAQPTRLNSWFFEVAVRDALRSIFQTKGIEVSKRMPLGWYTQTIYELLLIPVALLIPVLGIGRHFLHWLAD
jgi:hypothetical protein